MSNLEAMLSRGAVHALSSGQEFNEPVMKVLGHRKVPGGGQDRYRLLLTDGVEQHSFVMLGTQLNYLVEEDQLPVGTVVRITKHVVNNMKTDKPILIVIGLEIIGVSDNKEAGGAAAASANSKPLTDVNKPAFHTVEDTPPRGAGRPQGSLVVPQTPPQHGGRLGAAGGSSGGQSTPGSDVGGIGRVRPISSLNPYQNKWTICGRVTQKSQVRTWSNSRGEGKLFSFVLSDDSGEIRATAFRDEVEKYFELVEVGKPLYVSKGQLKAANKQFNTTSNEYEMVLNSDSVVQACEESEAAAVPEVKFNFVPIGQLDQVDANKFVDVCGVAHETHDCQTIIGRASQREIQKRDLTLVDSSGCSVRLTLWGEEAVKFNGDKKPVVVVKGAKVSDFGGRSLSASSNSSLMLNPAVPEANRLRGWYKAEGHQMQFDAFRGDAPGGGGGGGGGSFRSLSECKGGQIGMGEKFDYFQCLACVIHMKRDTSLYQACPKPDCNKKVIEYNGEFRCEKCQASFPNFTWRFLLQANLADHSDNQWVTCFQESAERLLGVSADELGRMKLEGDEAAMAAVFDAAMFKNFHFTLRAKMENYQDEMRLRVVVQEAKPLDFAEASKLLVGQIEALVAKA